MEEQDREYLINPKNDRNSIKGIVFTCRIIDNRVVLKYKLIGRCNLVEYKESI